MARNMEPSWLAERFARLAAATERLPCARALALTALALLTVGGVDRTTPAALNLIFFYLLVAIFAAWTLGLRSGLVAGVMTVVVATVIKGAHVGYPFRFHTDATAPIVWNAVSRLFATSTMVVLACGLRGALDLERHRAGTDVLTGALNKAAFLSRIDRVIAQAQQRGAALVFGYLDLDGFKSVNDRFGHAAGDAVLRAFSDGGARSVRDGDLFARFGGDEFTVLLVVPDCDRGDGAAEALHARLATILRQTEYPVTCSMGALVVAAEQVKDRQMLIEAADALMYEVKRFGKNAVRIARADLADGPVEGAGVAVRSAA